MRKLRLIVTLVLFLSLIGSSTVFANHPYSPKRHLTGMHTSTIHELYCVDVSDVSMTTSAAYSQMQTDLFYKNYDGLASNKVYWMSGGSGTDCKDLSSTALSTIQYRYYIQTATNTAPSPSPRCDGTSSCVNRYGYVSSGGHDHYDYGTLTIRYATYNSIREGIINHETGHLLGMPDGNESTCPTPSSIMHYACNYAGPSAADLTTVENEANS